MRILWLATSTMNVEPVIRSLDDLGGNDIHVGRIDRMGVPPDRAMLDLVDLKQPQVVLYVGPTGGPSLPSPTTFFRIKKRCPSVCIAFDASDASWQPRLAEYHAGDCFTLICNIDGNDDWPKKGADFTSITPIGRNFYEHQRPLIERPIKFGFSGGYASPSRRQYIEYLQQHAGLVVPQRNEIYGTYQSYADFMCKCRIMLNVPFSGSDNSNQVKGRVIEAGLAGNVLLEHIDSAAREWFKPDTDYATYESPSDAAVQVSRLLHDPQEMKRLATNLQHRVRNYMPKAFWTQLFERAGVA